MDSAKVRRQAGAVDAWLAAARCLGLDAVAFEVSSGLADAGVPAVLLKGASIARWLYGDGTVRTYGDVDLMVAPADFTRAEGVLAALGFTLARPGLSTREETGHGRVWDRAGAIVDLHHRLWGVGADATRAWAVLTRDLEQLRLGGGAVWALGRPARALHVALHAAQHGIHEAKPRQDLVRAGALAPFDTWRRAAALARELRAEDAMGAGLRLEPSTRRLADELGLPEAAGLLVALHAQGAPLPALGLARVAATPGLAGKLAMAGRRLVPTPARIRAQYRVPPGRPGALALAYAWRTTRLARAAPGAVRALVHAARRSTEGGHP